MRLRGVRYWWAGLGLVVLLLLYVMPVATAFRTSVQSFSSKPALPTLALPAIGTPVIPVPKLRPVAPLQTRAVPQTASHPVHAVAAVPGKRVVRHLVPVVSDKHSQVAPATSTSSASTPTDPYANAPVVSDSIGTPTALPSAPQTPTAPAAPAT